MRLLLLLGVVTWHVASSSAMSVPKNYEARDAVTTSINTFSNKFFKVIAEGESGKNVICSPISASMVLTMAAFGARGNTETQMRTALALNSNDGLTKTGTQELIESFNNYKQVELRLANKVFLSDRLTPKTEFMAITETNFYSKAQSLNFGKNVEATKIINDWAAAKTNNRIKDLVKENDIDSATALVLVNAVYFKGNWASKFNVADTKPRPFHVDATTVKEVPTMYQSGSFRYGELPEVKAKFVELPYKSADMSDAVSMFVILPDEITGLADLEKNLDKVTVQSLIYGGMARDVHVYLPKFKIESTIDLQDPLIKMGLTDMFKPDAANFTGIVDAPALYVSKVVQKAFIEVNEEGSEAAAATELIFATEMAVDIPTPPVELIVDHPFLYLIVNHSLKTIIFLGHYKNSE